ncbi:MAG: hypothetical protein AAGG45_06375 [Pseudomonadota bacterium]
MMKYGLAVGTLLLLGACATDTQTSDATSAKRLTASEKIGTTTAVNENGEEIICRRQKETGSRVKYKEVCGTQAQWDQLDDANREMMKDMTGDRAASNST